MDQLWRRLGQLEASSLRSDTLQSVRFAGHLCEGAMTAANVFPTDATDQLVQANIVAARYGR
jgi:hypothetical protein